MRLPVLLEIVQHTRWHFLLDVQCRLQTCMQGMNGFSRPAHNLQRSFHNICSFSLENRYCLHVCNREGVHVALLYAAWWFGRRCQAICEM